MAWLVGDSFDFYATITDVVGLWDTYTPTQGLANGRFSGSRAFQLSSGGSIAKSSGSNDATHHLAVAFNLPAASSTNVVGFLQLSDGAVNQCCVVFRGDGAILLTSATPAGTVLATYTGAFTFNAWNHFECEVTINNTTGAFHVRKNGNSSDDFAATSLNTRPGTNAYANKLTVGASFGANALMDDLLWFSTSGAVPNTWVGDVRAVQLMPTADTATKQFTGQFPALYTAQNSNNLAGTQAATANIARWMPVTAPASGTLSSLILNLSASATGNAKMALYDNTGSGGGPGTLLSTSSAVVNPTATLTTFAVSGGATVVKGATYFVGVLSDVSLSIFGATAGGQTQWSIAATYSSGFPATAVGFTTTGFVTGFSTIGMNVLAFNAALVNEAQEDGDTTYVFDNIVGHNDLYTVADLATPPLSVVAVQTRALVKKTDAGARAAQVQLKSNATTVTSTALLLSTSYQYTSRVDAVDPDTSAAWTGSAVNAIQIGPVVQA